MAVAFVHQVVATATETLASTLPTIASQQIPHNTLNSASETFGAATAVPVSVVIGIRVTLSAGAATLNLAAALDELGRTIDLTGLKVQSLRVKPVSTNANVISLTSGASSGYNLGSSSSFKWSGYATDEADFLWRDTNPDVDNTHKNIDFAGTGTQAIDLQIVAG